MYIDLVFKFSNHNKLHVQSTIIIISRESYLESQV